MKLRVDYFLDSINGISSIVIHTYLNNSEENVVIYQKLCLVNVDFPIHVN
jgi:hypothetical protein